jgi:hypothetical protein
MFVDAKVCYGTRGSASSGWIGSRAGLWKPRAMATSRSQNGVMGEDGARGQSLLQVGRQGGTTRPGPSQLERPAAIHAPGNLRCGIVDRRTFPFPEEP